MDSKVFKSGFSEVDYKWDSRIRRSIFPSFIIFFMSIFLTDKSLKYGIEQVPMLTVYVYYVYFFVYTAYVYPQRKKYNQQFEMIAEYIPETRVYHAVVVNPEMCIIP